MKRSQALMRFAIGSLWLIPAALLLFINIKMNPGASMGGSVSIIFFSITLFLWPLSALLDRKNGNKRATQKSTKNRNQNPTIE
jgi:hypothetical protein